MITTNNAKHTQALPMTCKVAEWCSKIIQTRIECGSMPNLMIALPNIGGALCSTPQSLVDVHH